ncbi:hypothetical protein SCLCIDRAFT_1221756 [Scleroderma citrinum Foug A]|uniref:Uncharacterized protein n=1 Tax=Scleroderma citrinum Foug A TaxID=1036808 RepID=A0A0C3DED7_9AGAM|nr:hypothetical protein SCLCIDRAFT_1221756 [Scleroderma citrinum Foug A]
MREYNEDVELTTVQFSTGHQSHISLRHYSLLLLLTSPHIHMSWLTILQTTRHTYLQNTSYERSVPDADKCSTVVVGTRRISC